MTDAERKIRGLMTSHQREKVNVIINPLEIALVKEFDRLERQREEWEDLQQSGFVDEGEATDALSMPGYSARRAILESIQKDLEKVRDTININNYRPINVSFETALEQVRIECSFLVTRINTYKVDHDAR